MTANSDIVTLADVAYVVMGQSPTGDTYNTLHEGIPLLNGPTEFGPSHPTPALWTTAPTKLCQPSDLLFCVRGSTTGRMNWADQSYCIGRGLAAIRAKAGRTDTRFAYYTLVNGLPRLLARCVGSVFPNLSSEDFNSFQISWPEPGIRLAITTILGTLDDKIDLNRRMNETLEAIARALFKSWFADFDPVRAQAEGRRPACMDKETAALFPDGFEESVLGEIPSGWSIGTLGEIADNPRRSVLPGEVMPGTSYIGLEHMPRKSIALGERGFAEEVASNKYQFRQGEILFGKLRPYFHKVGVAIQDGVCSTDILVITPKSPAWYGLVLSHVSSDELIKHTDASSTGTKMPRTNWQDIARYQIALPPKPIAQVFSERILPLVHAIRANILQSYTLAAIRDALLPKLLSGEIRVKEAEKLVEAKL